jgi:hypothetical protein
MYCLFSTAENVQENTIVYTKKIRFLNLNFTLPFIQCIRSIVLSFFVELNYEFFCSKRIVFANKLAELSWTEELSRS